MDRLICGDVGYGKTELAIRAAFKAIDNGKQVAVLVPTTVLAEQHYRTFSQRLAEYPFVVDSISRFRSSGEQRRILDRLASGAIDIIIGTHRLVSADVHFKELGLVVIDEEQRFGVEHKERLKRLRQMVDVLTMTATPIPRTLHLSLLGIRDISNLETPPRDRLAIETRIARFDPELIRHAINSRTQPRWPGLLRSQPRHGPETRWPIACERSCRKPASSLVTARWRSTNWNRRWSASSTATPIFCSAPPLSKAAWTFPTPTPFSSIRPTITVWPICISCAAASAATNIALTLISCSTATSRSRRPPRRLKAIEEFTELGAGFKIAMRDLEIRGAGNILGNQQSGHIASVGYEMYCQLLENAVRQ